MKQIAKTVLKGLLVVVLFTAGSVALSTTGAQAVNAANATVSYNQAYAYLVENGYTVISIAPSQTAKFDWVAQTIKNGRYLITTVTCTSVGIVAHSDEPM